MLFNCQRTFIIVVMYNIPDFSKMSSGKSKKIKNYFHLTKRGFVLHEQLTKPAGDESDRKHQQS